MGDVNVIVVSYVHRKKLIHFVLEAGKIHLVRFAKIHFVFNLGVAKTTSL